MKIVLYETDAEYGRRIKFYLPKKYASIEISVCSTLEELRKQITAEDADVVLVAEDYEAFQPQQEADLLRNAAFAYLSDTNEIISGVDTIYKYRCVSELYEQICSLYEKKKNRVIRHSESDEAKAMQIITFLPVHGGAGSSTMAAACAVSLGSKSSVLYLNLEQRPSDSIFFQGSNTKNLTNVISALRAKYTDASLFQLLKEVIQKDTKQNDCNVSFIKGYGNIMDSLSMNEQSLDVLLRTIREKFQFDYVIVDADYVVGGILQKLILSSDKLVFVSSGADISNLKLAGVRRYLDILSRDADNEMPANFMILNQYYPVANEASVTMGMEVIGRLARYRTDDQTRISSQAIIDEVRSKETMFDALIQQPAEAAQA